MFSNQKSFLCFKSPPYFKNIPAPRIEGKNRGGERRKEEPRYHGPSRKLEAKKCERKNKNLLGGPESHASKYLHHPGYCLRAVFHGMIEMFRLNLSGSEKGLLQKLSDEIGAFLQETQHVGAAHEKREAGSRQGGEQRDSTAVNTALCFTLRRTYILPTVTFVTGGLPRRRAGERGWGGINVDVCMQNFIVRDDTLLTARSSIVVVMCQALI